MSPLLKLPDFATIIDLSFRIPVRRCLKMKVLNKSLKSHGGVPSRTGKVKGELIMAYYLVTARPKSDRLGILLENLRKNAYTSIRPFGKTMTYSLQNARLREDGYVTWEEEDYCSPPLAQERAAALDEFFDELNITPVQEGTGWEKIKGLPRLFPELVQNP